MGFRTLGIIGGGRVSRILVGGLQKADALPDNIIVSDTDATALQRLKDVCPAIDTIVGDNTAPAAAELVVLAVHPPAIEKVGEAINPTLSQDTLIVSLAPVWSIHRLTDLLGVPQIVRMIPNAPSIIGMGYNPMTIAAPVSDANKTQWRALGQSLGTCPEVPEEHLEAYAIITAMGPTYFWFQWYELLALGRAFGLEQSQAQDAVSHMIDGAMRTVTESGIPPEAVLDLIPVKPLADQESTVIAMYREKLQTLYAKLTERR